MTQGHLSCGTFGPSLRSAAPKSGGGYPASVTTPMPTSRDSLRTSMADISTIGRQVSSASIRQPQRFRRQESWPPMQRLQARLCAGSALGSVNLPRQVSVPYPSSQSPWSSPFSTPSPFTPRGTCSLEFDDLYMEGAFFDPCQQPLKAQLLQKMRMQPNTLVEPMRGGIGSCNAGMWILRDSAQCYVLKLVRTNTAFVGPVQPAESEKFAKLCRENPGIVTDPSLSFPCKIFHCLSKSGVETHDLVVMRQVVGARVSEVIMQKLHSKQTQELMRILEQFGVFLADFHTRYNGMQHGDLTPANIFYPERSG